MPPCDEPPASLELGSAELDVPPAPAVLGPVVAGAGDDGIPASTPELPDGSGNKGGDEDGTSCSTVEEGPSAIGVGLEASTLVASSESPPLPVYWQAARSPTRKAARGCLVGVMRPSTSPMQATPIRR